MITNQRLEQNDRWIADNNLKCINFYDNVYLSEKSMCSFAPNWR